MNTVIIDDEAFAEVLVSLDCLEPQGRSAGDQLSLDDDSPPAHIATEDNGNLAKVPPAIVPEWKEIENSITTNDDMTHVSIDSSLLKSIMSLSIESIDMVTNNQTTSTSPETNKDIIREESNADIFVNKIQEESSHFRLVHEGPSTSVYHHSDPRQSVGGQTSDVAIKILSDDFPEDIQISRLNNEHDVSMKLAGRCRAVREAIGYSSLDSDGLHTLYLRWVPGITLREWAWSQEKRPGNGTDVSLMNCTGNGNRHRRRISIESCLSLALEVTKSLADIHDIGGFIVNNLSASNIIVDGSEGEKHNYSVHIIGLGSASCLRHESQNDGKISANKRELEIRPDLRALGCVLFELFSGQTPYQGDGDSHRENTILPLSDLRNILVSKSVPSFVSALILDVMEVFETRADAGTFCDELYQSARQIAEELNLMRADLDTTLAESNVGWLQISKGKLYGRDQSQKELINTFNRVYCCETREIILVSGFSGVGKTALMLETLQKPLWDKGGQLINVKFDQLHHGGPFAAMISAFSEFFANLAHGDPNNLAHINGAIQEIVEGKLLGVLTAMIPALCKIVGTQPTTKNFKVEGLMAKNQFKFAFRMLVKAFTTLMRPFVLLFDDLQWADSASLELLDALVLDDEIKALLIIECYRSNETIQDHPFNAHLNDVRNTGVAFTELHVENLNAGDVGKLISEVTYKPICETIILADTIHHKTGGNALLVIQFIKSAWNEGLLRYSSRLRSWVWNIELIKSKKILDDAASIMAQTISCLPSGPKKVLEKMACIGCQCEESILYEITREETNGVRENEDSNVALLHVLKIAIHNGLVEKVGSKFKFTHDQIQHGAYSCIPKDQKEVWHLQIGQLLLKSQEPENNLFVIVDQLNRGRPSIVEKPWLVCLAKLNCRAGEKAMSSVSFSSAAAYLKTGIQILKENHLEEGSELLIKMYSLYAEAEYCNGNFDEMQEAQEYVFEHVGCLNDTLQAYSTLIKACIAQNELLKAIEVGLHVLAQLGEKFTDTPDNSLVFKEFLKTAKMMKESDFTVLTSKRIDDKRMIYIMELIETLSTCAFLSRQELVPPFVFRMVQLTLSHGICSSTPFSFAGYSVLLCGPFEDISGACSCGNLALEMLEHVEVEQKVARISLLLYSFPFVWSKPFHSHLDPLLNAYNGGMKAGDPLYALMCASTYNLAAFYGGKDLSFLKKFLNDLLYRMAQYKQYIAKRLVLQYQKTLKILMGEDDNPMIVDGIEITFESLLNDATRNNDIQDMIRTRNNQLMIEYLFGNYELAAQVADENRELINNRMKGKFEVCFHAFYDGLTSLALARKTKDNRWIIMFQKELERIQKKAEHAPFNLKHKVLLLEAEYAFFVGEDNKASAKYDASASLAGKSGFVQDQALAYERAGIFYLEKGNESQAANYLGQAHNAYLEWGAKGKADHICTSYPI